MPLPTSGPQGAAAAQRGGDQRDRAARGDGECGQRANRGEWGAAAPAPAPPPWRVSVAALALRAGRLDWTDATTSPAAALALADFSLHAEKIGWPLAAPVVFRGEGMLGAGSRARQARVLG